MCLTVLTIYFTLATSTYNSNNTIVASNAGARKTTSKGGTRAKAAHLISIRGMRGCVAVKRCGKLALSGAISTVASSSMRTRVSRGLGSGTRPMSSTTGRKSLIAMGCANAGSKRAFSNNATGGCSFIVNSKRVFRRFRGNIVKVGGNSAGRVGVSFPSSCTSRALTNGRIVCGIAIRGIQHRKRLASR